MVDDRPAVRSPLPPPGTDRDGELTVIDHSLAPKWRTFAADPAPQPGNARRDGDRLTWSVSPGEWTIVGGDAPPDAVELTHVRAMLRLTGAPARRVLAKVCGLDLGDAMFPDGAAARTLVAGVATEIVRDDTTAADSYLLLPSRSFGAFLLNAICDAGEEFGIIHTGSGKTP